MNTTIIFWKPELVILALPSGLTVAVKATTPPSAKLAERYVQDALLAAA